MRWQWGNLPAPQPSIFQSDSEYHYCSPTVTILSFLNFLNCQCGSSNPLPTLQAEILNYTGVRLFNCLPRDIRDLHGVNTQTFNRRLDAFLVTIPGKPPVPHGPTSRGASSICIIDLLQYLKLELRCGIYGSPDWPRWYIYHQPSTRQDKTYPFPPPLTVSLAVMRPSPDST